MKIAIPSLAEHWQRLATRQAIQEAPKDVRDEIAIVFYTGATAVLANILAAMKSGPESMKMELASIRAEIAEWHGRMRKEAGA